jgi:hypothetical protein
MSTAILPCVLEDVPQVIRQKDGLGETIYAYVPTKSPGAGEIVKIDGQFGNDVIAYVSHPVPSDPASQP